MKKYLLFLIIFLSFSFYVSATPAPWGIAINEETKQCAGYWGGDEFGHNSLPQGWINIYPWSENWHKISSVKECDIIHNYSDDSAEICCEKNGYKYISENIGLEEEYKSSNEKQESEPIKMQELSRYEIVEKNNDLNFIVATVLAIMFIILFLFFIINPKKK